MVRKLQKQRSHPHHGTMSESSAQLGDCAKMMVQLPLRNLHLRPRHNDRFSVVGSQDLSHGKRHVSIVYIETYDEVSISDLDFHLLAYRP
jgi:hypothetical protein